MFEAAVAASWTVVGITFLSSSSSVVLSPVGREVHPFDYAWSVLYTVGGPVTVIAILLNGRGGTAWNVAGLTLLATGLAMQGVAALTFSGRDLRWAIYFIYAAACAMRAALCVVQAKRGT